MKTIFISLAFFYLMPAILAAQPVISTNEYYHIGDVIQMVKCDLSGLSAGAPGAALSWNFSTVGAGGGTFTTTVAANTSSVFLTSNIIITTSDGVTTYETENNTDSYINGVISAGVTTNYNNYDFAKRPVGYNTTYLDSYSVNIPVAPLTNGKGIIRETGDAYGTLTLPTGVFNNVLRIKKYQTETDTISGASATSFTTSYLWFDTVHSAPLFRIDSTVSISGNTQSAMYLAVSAGITDLNSSQNNYNASLHNNELLLTGSFAYGEMYEVVIYNIIGSKIFSEEFTSYSNSHRFDIDRQVNPGIYIVSIIQKNDPSGSENIKVVDQ